MTLRKSGVTFVVNCVSRVTGQGKGKSGITAKMLVFHI